MQSDRGSLSGDGARIVIISASGFTNLGDDAILAAMLTELRDAVPAAKFSVVSGAPARLPDADVDFLPFEEAAIEVATADADLMVVGGGGFIYDYDDRLLRDEFADGKSTAFYGYYRAALLAERLGVPVHFYAIGVGPLLTPTGRSLTRDVLSRASAITVRDPISLQELRNAGVNRPQPELTADPAVRLPRVERAPDRSERLAVGFVPRVWLRFAGTWTASARQHFDRYLDWLAAAADHVIERLDATPVFLPTQRLHDDDLEIAAEVIARMRHAARARVEEVTSYEALQAAIAGCDAIVSARLHPLIFGALAEVPVVGLTLAPKVRAFLSAVGLDEFAVSPWLADSSALETAIERALVGGEALRAHLRRGMSAQAVAAARNPAVAACLLRAPSTALGA